MTSLARIAVYLWLGYTNERICELMGAEPEIVQAMRERFI